MFARRRDNRQTLAYQTSYCSESPTALIVPLPVADSNRAHSVNFVNLSSYKDIFVDLERAFSRNSRNPKEPKYQEPWGVVTPVEIVYLPNFDDLNELPSCYTIAPELWAQLPQYKNHGFIVVKLPSTGGSEMKIAPFAVEFTTKMGADMLWFPTLQLRELRLSTTARHNSVLYYQGARLLLSDHPASLSLEESIDISRSGKLFSGGSAFKRHLVGNYPNCDAVV